MFQLVLTSEYCVSIQYLKPERWRSCSELRHEHKQRKEQSDSKAGRRRRESTERGAVGAELVENGLFKSYTLLNLLFCYSKGSVQKHSIPTSSCGIQFYRQSFMTEVSGSSFVVIKAA